MVVESEPDVQAAGEEGDTNTENAGSTPLPREGTDETVEGQALQTPKEEEQQEVPAAPQLEISPPAPVQQPHPVPADKGHAYSFRPGGDNLPLTINHVAISASAQNKLPVNKVKGIVLRVSKPTESSQQKHGGWYRSPTYVDKDSYTWQNMPLFDDHQTHLWTREGTVRSSCKK